jgi:2-dehydropantoate 2-reductase
MNDKLRVISIGAGAIGTYIGGSLALNGHRVVFVERPVVAKVIEDTGLKLNLHGVEHEVTEPEVVGSLDEALMLGDFDFAIFALKSYDTSSALEQLTRLANKLPPFLCLSNGVENEVTISRVFGEDKVIYGTVTTAVGKRGLGNIEVEKFRGVGVAKGHPLSEKVAKAFDEAGLNCKLYENPLDMKWSKMLTNLISNATSAILDMPPREVFIHPGLYYLEISMLRECLAVMEAQGINVVDLPGTPVKALAFAVKYLPLWLSRPLLARGVGGGRGDKMPSFHIDLHSGRGKSEVSYLNGAVVREGERLGIPTPANLLLNETLIALTVGRESLEEYHGKPEVLLEQL